jgi:hypothetical protein
MQSPALQATAQADYLGRAAEILQRQVESTEVYLMNVCNNAAQIQTGIPTIPAVGLPPATYQYNVITSGLGTAVNGDTTYTVTTTITSVTATYFRVVVNVTWIPNTPGISQVFFVARQVYFTAGC